MNKFGIIKKLSAIILTVTLVFCMFSLSGCISHSNNYSESEHIQRVTNLAKKRYIQENTPYSDLHVYPLYNKNDKLEYFLIEMEPYGYDYIKLHDNDFGHSLYTRNASNNWPWARYVVEIGSWAYLKDDNGIIRDFKDRRWTELDENNDPIIYKCSHFKAADIQDERRYLLDVDQDTEYGWMPAVKRNGRYLNLLSMDYMDYKYSVDTKKWPIAGIGSFEPTHLLDL